MKVAAAAALVAAIVLALAVTGVFGQPAPTTPSDTIRLESGSTPVPSRSPSASPTSPGRTETVHRQVKEEPFDDKGGDRRDAERAAGEDNSGKGSSNSGSGSGSDDED